MRTRWGWGDACSTARPEPHRARLVRRRASLGQQTLGELQSLLDPAQPELQLLDVLLLRLGGPRRPAGVRVLPTHLTVPPAASAATGKQQDERHEPEPKRK